MQMKFHSSLFVAGLTLAAPAAAQGADFCNGTAQFALSSCQDSAESDRKVALGKCENVSDAAARTACVQQAKADSTDASQNCQAELSVRQTACKQLGKTRYDPVIVPANFTTKIDNPYFPLKPGTTFIYEGTNGGAKERDEFAVTHNTVKILGVTTVEVHDKVFTNGELTEDTLDWFAQDKQGNVWYFGENTQELIGGRPSTLSGTFTSGINGDKPGIIMEAHPHIGDFYRQEFSLENAEDYAAVKSLTDTITVPFRTFKNCLGTPETTPLEPDLNEEKWYAPGVGQILTKDLTTGEVSQLIAIKRF
jgi:hypothetical protein